MSKKYLSFSDLRAAYVPKDDTISVTSSDPELAEAGFRMTLQKHTAAERLLRKKLEAAGLIRLPEGEFPTFVTYTGHAAQHVSSWNIFPLGVNRQGDWVGIDVLDGVHTWLAGATGSGKSIVLNTLIAHAAANSDRWDIKVLDLRKVELANPLAKIAALSESVDLARDQQEMLTQIQALHELMMNRYSMMEEQGLRGSKELIEAHRLKAQLLVIDEAYLIYGNMQESSEEADRFRKFHELLMDILRIGRAAGIFVVLATQRPDPGAYPADLRNQLTNRILLGRTSERNALIVVDWIPREIKDVPKGRGHVNLFGERDEVQFFYSDFDTIKRAASL